MSNRRIALLSNVMVDLIANKLRKNYSFYLPEGYDTWVQEAINLSSGLYSERLDAVIVLLDGIEARGWRTIEEGKERIEIWKQALNIIVSHISVIPIFVSTIDFQESRIRSLSERSYKYEMENDWYQYVQGLVENKGNVFIFDLADTIAEIGRKHFYSNKMWYMSSMPYSKDGLDAVSNDIDRILRSAFTTLKKILVLDLDNTLWGGVIGEDGIDGIELSNHKEGQRFYDFQRQLLEMKNRGIVLGVVSKNNEDDAEAAIKNHPAMLLRDDAFVSKMINWKNKAVNLKAMESELNLTEGSFVFIDDNPIERETVKGECPDMMVPDFPIDTTELIHFAEDIWFGFCRPLRVLSEDLQKTQMYQNEAKRRQEQESSLNLDDYIAKLEMVADIHKMRDYELERVVQLINKTNQFNVTTKRYTQAEIEAISADKNNAVYVVHSSDKYGENGLISVIILKGLEDYIKIDTFIMSCRVMGRKLEDVIMDEITAKYRKKIIGEFIPTAKNVPVRELYNRLGFLLVSDEEGHKIYEFDGTGYQKKGIGSYKEIRFEG